MSRNAPEILGAGNSARDANLSQVRAPDKHGALYPALNGVGPGRHLTAAPRGDIISRFARQRR
jgi:hypothetical protein